MGKYLIRKVAAAGVATAVTLTAISTVFNGDDELTEFGTTSVPANEDTHDLAERFQGNTIGYYKYMADDEGNVPVDVAFCNGDYIIDGTGAGVAGQATDVQADTCKFEGMIFDRQP